MTVTHQKNSVIVRILDKGFPIFNFRYITELYSQHWLDCYGNQNIFYTFNIV